MDEKLFEELENNLQQAISASNRNTAAGPIYMVLSPTDIKEIRQSAGMSQSAFATTFQISLDTLKGWEQGKRKPDAAATNFLRVIRAMPNGVATILLNDIGEKREA